MKMFFKRKNIVLLVIMLLCSLGMLAEEKTVALPEKPIVSRMILDNLFSYSSSYSRLIDEYKADIYLKGRVKVHKRNKLIRYVPSMFRLEKDVDDFEVLNDTPLMESGTNIRLTGNQALAFSRIRYLDSDYKRVDRQREVLMGMAYGLKDMGMTTAVGLIPTLLESVETNLSMSELMTLAGIALNMDLSTIEQMRLPAEGTYESGTMNGTWKIIADMDENAQILHDFIYTETEETTEE